MKVIEIQPLPSQVFQVVLDGQECTISLFQRLGSMYLDLTVGTSVICEGAICQYGADIVQSKSSNFDGSLRFYDDQGLSAPKWEEIGSRYYLLYFSEGETMPEALGDG